VNTDNPLWTYATTLWQHEAAKYCLLAQQDDQGLRINLLICAMWLGAQSRKIAPVLPDLMEATQTLYYDTILPLRRLRQQSAQHSSNTIVKKALLKAELRAEREELAIMYALTQSRAFVPVEACYDKQLLVQSNLRCVADAQAAEISSDVYVTLCPIALSSS